MQSWSESNRTHSSRIREEAAQDALINDVDTVEEREAALLEDSRRETV